MGAAEVLERVVAERTRQDAKWGVQDHSPYTWLVILMEEVGECSEAALAMTFADTPVKREERIEELKRELVQVAAVAVAACECLERDAWRRRPSHLARERLDIAHEEAARMTPARQDGARRVLQILAGDLA